MRTKVTLLCASVLLCGTSGCAGLTGIAMPSSICGEERGGSSRWTAPDLVRTGNGYLEQLTDSSPANAMVCYLHALQINPEDYGAHLGIGVANIMTARMTGQMEHLYTARTHLGQALAIRPFHFETIYYLAEFAVLEEKYTIAKELLTPLLKAGYKKGPVNTLAGDVYLHLGETALARKFYAVGANEGWPISTARYAQERK